MTTFSDLSGLTALYPELSGTLHHRLTGHPMFELDALIALAARMRPVDVEYNRGNLPVGVDSKANIQNGLNIADTIRGIEENGSWMVLKFIEKDAEYRALLNATLNELMPVVGDVTGEMLKREGFIFISSPNAVTPFHFDPEHNILMQLRGTKSITVFPADDERIVAGIEHERFHMGGHRNLPWREEIATRGRVFDLVAGDAIYVPVKAPHWVQNGPGVSISFSATWRSEWSYMEADARGMNSMLRRLGLPAAAPKRFPNRNLAKSVGYRAIRKIRGIFAKA
ncbi:transcriptional regulator [Sphingomonas paeninsulae]|uniref:Transcriptional regulator n=1 Tax=Sphingomonas paeninsulae TaxID=2319844 RepID=A0A494TN13_SPHPE|nr:cupin-like domain-containing protein [Sphingomonas paeninsulae]AYJ87206.1 transcriptional regulator [Sphingomonas paeninsulae]